MVTLRLGQVPCVIAEATVLSHSFRQGLVLLSGDITYGVTIDITHQ